VLPLDRLADHPVDALMGTVAPDDWSAIGVVATGRARRLDRPTAAMVPVLVVLLVDRSGAAVSLLPRLDGGGRYEAVEAGDGPEGLMLDLCRRALGLPTAPPGRPPLAWWAQLWLDGLLRDALAVPGRVWTWGDVLVRHPLHDLLDPDPDSDDCSTIGLADRLDLDADPAAGPAVCADADRGGVHEHRSRCGPDDAPVRFADAITSVVGGHGWDRIRRASAVGPGGEHAAWMDAGCFARWTLGKNLELPVLLAELRSVLPTPMVRSVAATLGRWELLA
jgi:hypothetical protein